MDTNFVILYIHERRILIWTSSYTILIFWLLFSNTYKYNVFILWCFTESLPMANRCMRHDLNESVARCYVALDKTAEALDLAQNLVISCTVSCGSLINFLPVVYLSVRLQIYIHVCSIFFKISLLKVCTRYAQKLIV